MAEQHLIRMGGGRSRFVNTGRVDEAHPLRTQIGEGAASYRGLGPAGYDPVQGVYTQASGRLLAWPDEQPQYEGRLCVQYAPDVTVQGYRVEGYRVLERETGRGHVAVLFDKGYGCTCGMRQAGMMTAPCRHVLAAFKSRIMGEAMYRESALWC